MNKYSQDYKILYKRKVEEVKVLERALELACKSVEYANYCSFDNNPINYLDFKKEFIEQAKEELKDE